MRVSVGYCRVSTEAQANSGLGIAAQRERVEARALADGVRLDRVFADEGISGATLDRPAFAELLGEADAGRIAAVYTYSFSRVSRSTADMLALVERFARRGVRLVSLTEGFDTGSAAGEFMVTVFAALSQLERKQIGERTSAALRAKQARGERIGNVPYGFQADRQGRLHPHAGERRTVERARFLRGDGLSLRDIAKRLNAEGRRTRRGSPWSPQGVAQSLLRVARFGGGAMTPSNGGTEERNARSDSDGRRDRGGGGRDDGGAGIVGAGSP